MDFYQKVQLLLKVEENNIQFIGPSKKTMELMGDKITARQTVDDAGVPVIPGSKGAVNSVDEIKELAEEIGYPVVLKAASGGGGKGIRIVKSQNNLKNPLKKRKAKVKNTLTMTEFMLKHLYL